MARKKTDSETPTLFDTSDDDDLLQAAAMQSLPPSQLIEAPFSPPPRMNGVRPPPPRSGVAGVAGAAGVVDAGRPATTSDTDRILSSLAVLAGKFDGVQSDISALKVNFDNTSCLLYTSPSPRD